MDTSGKNLFELEGLTAAPSGVPNGLSDAVQAGRIRLLPSELADQIAAGEVVERPASVVKELVENSLDAGAQRIEVAFEQGGRTLISVVDDGGGMSPEEAQLALVRHATSKLRSADDLMALRTMGFRGEALPSIAAVSKLTLTTRTAGSDEGFRVALEAGRRVEARTAGCAVGAQVEVRELLFNVPARLKFLKTDATESGQISEAMVRLALAHPEVHFRLVRDGRLVLDLPRVGSRLARAQAVLARQGGDQLVEVTGVEGGEGEESLSATATGLRVHALLAPPTMAVTTARNSYLFIGRRFVRDRGLLSAMVAGYGELLAGGRYPFALVFLDVPDGEVDVNVHPQKLEVRLSRPADLHQLVRRTIRRRLAEGPWAATAPRSYRYDPAPWTAGGSAPSLEAGGVEGAAEPGALGAAATGMRATEAWPGSRTEAASWSGAREGQAAQGGASGTLLDGQTSRGYGGGSGTQRSAQPSSGYGGAPSPRSGPGAGLGDLRPPWEQPASPRQAALEKVLAPQVGRFAQLRYLGQIDRTFLICEGEGELVLLDQHAAHERVVFDRLQRGFLERRVASQRLLMPLVLELTPVEQAVAEEHADALSALGFEFGPFGGGSWALTATPELSASRDAVALVRELLAELAEEVVGNGREAAEVKMLATVACHSSLRAGDEVDPREVDALLRALDTLDGPPNCPHGRPVAIRMGSTELARRFGRSA